MGYSCADAYDDGRMLAAMSMFAMVLDRHHSASMQTPSNGSRPLTPHPPSPGGVIWYG